MANAQTIYIWCDVQYMPDGNQETISRMVSMYIIKVEYDPENSENAEKERKKVQYIVRKNEGEVLSSNVFLIGDDRDLIKNIMARTYYKRVEVYESGGKKEDFNNPDKKNINENISANHLAIEMFLNYLLSKINATQIGKNNNKSQTKEYSVSSRKGNLHLKIKIQEMGSNETKLSITLIGFDPVLTEISEQLKEEIIIFKGGLS